MTNNTPDYNDNLFFEEKKMTDCKNCPYTDEYCASGDCERDNDLTDKWKKGELPNGSYYVKHADGEIETAEYKQLFNEKTQSFYFKFDFEDEISEVLAPVPTFDEWKASYNCMLENEVLRLKNTRLEELLKECELWFTGIVGNMNDKNVGEHNRSLPIGNFKYAFKKFSQKIDEVLK